MFRPTADHLLLFDVNLAGAVITYTLIYPKVLPANSFVAFQFPNNEAVRAAITVYDTLPFSATAFAQNRAWCSEAADEVLFSGKVITPCLP